MVNLSGFNAAKVEPTGPGGAIPAGDYQVIIVESGEALTKAGDNRLVNLTLQIVEGEHKGRKLYDRLNLWNKNAKAKAIAEGTLSAICRAVNVLEPKDSTELHHKQLTARVVVGEYEGKPRNEVKGYMPKKTGSPAAFQAPSTGGQSMANPFG